MAGYRTVKLGAQMLKVEFLGGCVNVERLTDSEGHEVIRVDVSADGDRYSRDVSAQAWCADAGDKLSAEGIGVRIVRGIEKPKGGKRRAK